MIMRPKRKLSQVQAEEKGNSVTYKDLIKRRELKLGRKYKSKMYQLKYL